MNLRQIQVAYDPREDRLLIRAASETPQGVREEVRAWVTRRLAAPLWEGIVQGMQAQAAGQPIAEAVRREIVGMQHEAAVAEQQAQGQFAAPFEQGAQSYPVGETPLLIDTFHLATGPGEPLRMILAPSEGAGFQLAMSGPLLHGFCRLLQNAVSEANWGLALVMPGAPVEDGTPRTLN